MTDPAVSDPLVEKIRSRGHWRVVVRPKHFVERRVPQAASLLPIIERCSVQLRGWDYPHVDRQGRSPRGQRWVGQGTDWSHYVEYWRFYQSGQFVHLFGLREDWLDQSHADVRRAELGADKVLWVWSALFEFTEIFEFAARLAVTPAGDSEMLVEIGLHGLTGRRLVDADARPSFFGLDLRREVAEDKFVRDAAFQRDDLIANRRDLAIEYARDLYGMFGFDASTEALRQRQFQLRLP